MIVKCFCDGKLCAHCGDADGYADGYAKSDTCSGCGRSRYSCRLCGANGLRRRFVERLNELLLDEMSLECQRAVIELDAAGFLAAPPRVGPARALVIGLSTNDAARELAHKLFPQHAPEAAPGLPGASWSWMAIGRSANYLHANELRRLAEQLEAEALGGSHANGGAR